MIFPLSENGHIKTALQNAISSNKIPHAIIIEGENGLGKKTLARFIAMAAICTGADKPCGECENCRLETGSNHPDIIRIRPQEKKKSILVEQIRDMRQEVYIKPHTAERKVYIIEQADTMNASSQNAILKVLEEPPQDVCFILLCENRSSLLPTVVSRCVTFTLYGVSNESGIPIVSKLAKCDADAAEQALIKTHGNIGRAINTVKKSNKNSPYFVANEFLDLCFKNDGYQMLKLLHPHCKDRVFFDGFLSELKCGAAERIKETNKNGKSAKILYLIYDNCDKYAAALKTNVNLSLLACSITADINEQMR